MSLHQQLNYVKSDKSKNVHAGDVQSRENIVWWNTSVFLKYKLSHNQNNMFNKFSYIKVGASQNADTFLCYPIYHRVALTYQSIQKKSMYLTFWTSLQKRIVAYSFYECFHDVCLLGCLDCKNCYNKYNTCKVIM